MTGERVLLSWSSGKDSAWSLHDLRRAGHHVVALFTTIAEGTERVSMQRVRRSLLRSQAAAVGVPVWEVLLPEPCPNEVYEQKMAEALERARDEDVRCVAFGDLYLDDIRAYREEMLAGTGIEPVFPLWTSPGLTGSLAETMIGEGLAATITCVDTSQLDGAFVGRSFDRELLADLPPGVDPLGERGEFHTVCHDGPMFAHPLEVEVGDVQDEGRFVWVDVWEPAGR